MRQYKVEKSVGLDRLEEILNRYSIMQWDLVCINSTEQLVYTIVFVHEADALRDFLDRRAESEVDNTEDIELAAFYNDDLIDLEVEEDEKDDIRTISSAHTKTEAVSVE